MKRFTDEELHAMQMVSEFHPDNISGLYAQNTIIIELLSRVLDRGQVTTPSAKAKGFYPCVYHAERDCSPSLNNILASLLNRSFANRIEKGQFIPELKQGDFLRPVLSGRVIYVLHRFPFGQPAPGTSPTGTSYSTGHPHLQPRIPGHNPDSTAHGSWGRYLFKPIIDSPGIKTGI